jgi:tRNA pseudouridine55 synthase
MMLLIDKPKGITSYDVIRILRKSLGVKKIGHSGTLDPLATGLLLIAVGDETKTISQYVGLPKTYEVEALIGEKRSTGDMEGNIVEKLKVEKLDSSEIDKVVYEMIGEHALPVPVYSAVKQGGEPIYKKARRGEKVDVPIKKMEIMSLNFENVLCEEGRCIIKMTMDVSSGSYVRSIVEEFGKRLGYPATTKELRRTKIGEFDVRSAETIK